MTWTGQGRPAPGTVVDLSGVSTTGSLDVVAATVVGTCDDPYRLPC